MKKYYFVGIKGSGMSALAQLLHDYGHDVSGYDDTKHYTYTEDELIKRNIQIYYSPIQLEQDVVVVKSAAVRYNHEQILIAKENNLVVKEYFELLSELTKAHKTIAISGTHGKTTTTALISNILKEHEGVNYIIGDGTGKGNKESDLFVIEACEFKRHFLNYHPTYTVITNIEYEHVEYYKSIDDVIDAFQNFVNQTKSTVVAYGEDENIKKIKSNNIKYYGFNDECDIVAKNIAMNEKGSKFDVYINKAFFGTFDTPLYGNHMILNALSVIYICFLENVNLEKIQKGLMSFSGAKRRFNETIIGDIVSIDDYAHHPTEITATIESARQKYPNKKIVAVFKPNTYSRTKELYNDFAKALMKADDVYITDIYCDRELPEEFPGVTSDLIIKNVTNAKHIKEDNLDVLLNYKNAVMLFMSCKDIYTMRGVYESKLKNEIRS